MNVKVIILFLNSVKIGQPNQTKQHTFNSVLYYAFKYTKVSKIKVMIPRASVIQTYCTYILKRKS